MLNARLTLIAGLTTLAASSSVMAADETVGALPTVKQGIATAITAIVVFTITAVFLHRVVWPLINKGLADRENRIRNAIQEAELARQQARSALEQYQKDLAEARAKAQADLEAARAQQAAIAAEIKARNERELAMEREKAMREIEAAKKLALSEIYTQTGMLVSSVAAKVLRREVNKTDQDRLVSEALAELKPERISAN